MVAPLKPCDAGKKKKFLAKRLSSGQRYFDESDVRAVLSGSMNFKRKQFLHLVDRIQRGEIQKLIVAHKARLVRFGFYLINDMATQNGCEIVVMNQESLSPEQEMVEDLMDIAHTFSGRLYGMRKYKKQIREYFVEYKIATIRDNLQ